MCLASKEHFYSTTWKGKPMKRKREAYIWSAAPSIRRWATCDLLWVTTLSNPRSFLYHTSRVISLIIEIFIPSNWTFPDSIWILTKRLVSYHCYSQRSPWRLLQGSSVSPFGRCDRWATITLPLRRLCPLVSPALPVSYSQLSSPTRRKPSYLSSSSSITITWRACCLHKNLASTLKNANRYVSQIVRAINDRPTVCRFRIDTEYHS